MVFSFSRYKFVTKMFEDFDNVLEVGAGDGFKSHIVKQFCKKLTLTDIEKIINHHLKKQILIKILNLKFIIL